MTLREQVFARDHNRCRICEAMQQISGWPLELAHLKAKGMGGSDALTVPENLICCCRAHHQGNKSIHSGHLKWHCLTDQGANGPMAFTFCERLPKAELGVRIEIESVTS